VVRGDFRLPVDRDLLIQPLGERDVPELFRLTDDNRLHLRRWLPWLDGVRTPADTRAFVARARACLRAREELHAGIRAEGVLIGVIGLHRVDWDNRATSMGYWLAAAWQGRGVMTRACRTFTTYALRDLGLHRVEIRCAVGNARSRGIPERLGFTVEGTLREAEWLYDHFVDLVVYGMLARDWPDGADARAT
jgi:ribosomal-protein-serine acetyltransferase